MVKIKGEIDLEDVALSLISGIEYKPAIIIANKIDNENSESKYKILEKKFGKKIKIMRVSLKRGEEKSTLGLFNYINVKIVEELLQIKRLDIRHIPLGLFIAL